MADKGADVNRRDEGIFKWTPLIWASSNGHREVVELLLAKGADVNAWDEVKNKDTPL